MKPEHLWLGTVCLFINASTVVWIVGDSPRASLWLLFAGLGIGVLPTVIVGLMNAWSAVRARAQRGRRRSPRDPS